MNYFLRQVQFRVILFLDDCKYSIYNVDLFRDMKNYLCKAAYGVGIGS